MTGPTRRAVLKSAALGVSTFATGRASVSGVIRDRVVLGVIGTGGMGMNHIRHLATRKDVTIRWICDVDSKRLAAAAQQIDQTTGTSPFTTSDLRNVLDDQQVDAVIIATPDHWHAPASLLALDAGHHVYVEKPCCHNVHEGRLLVDAVKRTGKLLQVGTQSRSTRIIREAIHKLHSGAIGEVLTAKAWNSQKRGSIGKSQPSKPPRHLDFEMWCGPAVQVPYRKNLLPAVWRWWYDFGCGDIGNDGVHDIDVALWGLNPAGHPDRVTCLGGKYFFDDDQQFPDTQYAVCEFPAQGAPSQRKKQLIFEQRDWSPYTQEGYENGAAFYGTAGLLILGHTVGWKLFGPRNKLIEQRQGPADLRAHHDNFLNCVRGTESVLNADIEAGHRSATIVHLANIAARTGNVLEFDAESERITNDSVSNALLKRSYRPEHWAVPKSPT